MVVFQNYALLPWRTALKTSPPFVNQTVEGKTAIVREHLAMVGLRRCRKPTLRWNETVVSIALAIRPKVLILDEPWGVRCDHEGRATRRTAENMERSPLHRSDDAHDIDALPLQTGW